MTWTTEEGACPACGCEPEAGGCDSCFNCPFVTEWAEGDS